MKKNVLIAGAVAVFLVVGLVFASTNLFADDTVKDVKEAKLTGCSSGNCGKGSCDGSCGGNCGIASCGCGK
ncbi:MAG: hypothetical protein PHG05_03265 [Candidatus Nanoarchaeia archaeon]|nr:hypothetical protein [Candidatus Nanoarchaeia archaeon]